MQTTKSEVRNYWPDSRCARAFWGQQELPPYRRLLADTLDWLDPQPGESWLDLGCGCGQLTRGLWEKGKGQLSEIVAVDCAAANERAIEKLSRQVQPAPANGQLRFFHASFSDGLPYWEDGEFDGVVSGLSIQYAESFSEADNCWTTDAYDRVLSEVHRLLRDNGRFIFSVNVPEPAWGKVALGALHGIFSARHPARYAKNAFRMLRYGAWLKREARRGRFHYLPIETIVAKLAAAGFVHIEHRLTYASQAFLLRCRKR